MSAAQGSASNPPAGGRRWTSDDPPVACPRQRQITTPSAAAVRTSLTRTSPGPVGCEIVTLPVKLVATLPAASRAITSTTSRMPATAPKFGYEANVRRWAGPATIAKLDVVALRRPEADAVSA